jgi:RPA family protein
MVEYRKRDTAYIVSNEDLLTGEFFKTEGWDPNYVKIPIGLHVSRATIAGTVVETDQSSISVDDTTGIMRIRTFDPFPGFELITTGDYVVIIGKVRQFSDSLYITPEVCMKQDKAWHTYFQKQQSVIKDLFKSEKIINPESKIEPTFSSGVEAVQEIVTDATEQVSAVPENNKVNYLEKVITYIDEEDTGNGVEKVKLLEKFADVDDITDILETLIMEGDIFEIKPGVFKVLK